MKYPKFILMVFFTVLFLLALCFMFFKSITVNGFIGTTKRCNSLNCWKSTEVNGKGYNFATCLDPSAAGIPVCHSEAFRTKCGLDDITEEECQNRKCCWNLKQNEPSCFVMTNTRSTYIVSYIRETTFGLKITIKTKDEESIYGPNISPLVVEISAQSNERLHVKIYDPNNKRWEIPTRFLPLPPEPERSPSSPLYSYIVASIGEDFHFSIIRKSDNDIVFDTCRGEGLQFTDQFLSMGTRLPDNYNIYGLGEHVVPSLRLPQRIYTMWNYDTMSAKYPSVYGSHPFYLEHRPSGNSHGVFLRNSNGMDVILSETSLIYNTIGGVLDFYFFLGPSPESVIQQYQEVIGRPQIPPYWGLGFHHCRYGYENYEVVKEVVILHKESQIPLDTIWSDIDHMDEYKSFTIFDRHYPEEEMAKFIDEVHASGQHYVFTVDPGMSIKAGYKPYEDGIKMDIFIKDSNNEIFTGKVWPGRTAFPDFFHPKANEYWEMQISNFHDTFPFDGLLIDINEIANFEDGNNTLKKEKESVMSKFINPPYSINNQGFKAPLNTKTLAVHAVHYGDVLEYDAHNLYGFTHTIATSKALENIIKKRSFVISRSTFPGSGVYGGHSTGDNHATWEDMAQSVVDILNFQMFGIPLVGADICGFDGDTDSGLCGRWIQLGAFYPFARNHNRKNSVNQELYTWRSVADISRKVLNVRYSLLPYYYTLFYKAHVTPNSNSPSATVLRPLFFEFPRDKNTFNISTQFMVGRALLVSPVLQKDATSVVAYFPHSKWYDFHTLNVVTREGEVTIKLETPSDHFQLHIRGGNILPLQYPALTTTASRLKDFFLIVALNENGAASGELFWDDGESVEFERYIFMDFLAVENTVKSKVYGPGYEDSTPVISLVTVVGVTDSPTMATLNGDPIDHFNYDHRTHILELSNLFISMSSSFEIHWMEG